MFRGRFLDKAPSKVLVILKKFVWKTVDIYLIGNLFACCKSVKFILISSFNPMLYTINPLIYTTWIHLYTTLILHIYNINIWFFDQQYTTTYSQSTTIKRIKHSNQHPVTTVSKSCLVVLTNTKQNNAHPPMMNNSKCA